jgi:hypothetical protein
LSSKLDAIYHAYCQTCVLASAAQSRLSDEEIARKLKPPLSTIQEEEEIKAATKIQAGVRGYLTRKRIKNSFSISFDEMPGSGQGGSMDESTNEPQRVPTPTEAKVSYVAEAEVIEPAQFSSVPETAAQPSLDNVTPKEASEKPAFSEIESRITSDNKNYSTSIENVKEPEELEASAPKQAETVETEQEKKDSATKVESTSEAAEAEIEPENIIEDSATLSREIPSFDRERAPSPEEILTVDRKTHDTIEEASTTDELGSDTSISERAVERKPEMVVEISARETESEPKPEIQGNSALEITSEPELVEIHAPETTSKSKPVEITSEPEPEKISETEKAVQSQSG